MGALFAYEVAHRMCARGQPLKHAFVSGYPALHLPRDSRIRQYSDDALIQGTQHVRGAGGRRQHSNSSVTFFGHAMSYQKGVRLVSYFTE